MTRWERLQSYIDKVKTLPPTPSLMLKLLALFKNQEADIDQVVELVSRDPSLTAEVLKKCNSACVRGEGAVADMFEGVTRLGFYEVYLLTIEVSGSRAISCKNIEQILDIEALCRHSKATAVAAKIISQALAEDAVLAFLAGLMHDIGKIVLASGEGANYRTLFAQVKSRQSSLSEAEKKMFGFDHSEIGGALLERWDLPAEVVTVVNYHHNIEAATQCARLTAIVTVADMLANAEEQKSSSDDASVKNFAHAVQLLQLSVDDFNKLQTEVHQEIEKEGIFPAKPARLANVSPQRV